MAFSQIMLNLRSINRDMRHTCILGGLLLVGFVCISCKCNGRNPNIVVQEQITETEISPEPPFISASDLPESYLQERQKHLVPDEWIDARLRNARKDSVLHDAPSFEEMSLDAALNYYGRPDEMLKYGDTLILGYGAYSYYFVRDTLIWIIVD